MSYKELKPAEWDQELHHAMQYRRKYGLEDKWGQLEAMLYHVKPEQANSGPNIMISTLDSLASAMNVPQPYITVKARNTRSITKARLLESVDNLLIDTMDFQSELDYLIPCAFLWGRGILKIGYDSEFGWDDTLDIGLWNPRGMSQSQWDKKMECRLETGNVQPGMPWVKNVLPHDFLVPWGVRDIKEAPWCAHRIVRHIDAVRADLKYDKNVTRRLQPNMTMEDFVKSYQSTMRPYRVGQPEQFRTIGGPNNDGTELEYIELWEIRDARTKRIKVMATGGSEWLRDDPDGLQLQGLPFVSLSFVPRARNFWVTPDAWYLFYHQKDLSDIAVQTTMHRRLAQLKILYEEGSISPEQLDRLLSGEIGAAIGIKPGMDLDKVVKLFTAAVPNLNFYQDSQFIRTNAREMVGFSQNQIGEFESSGRRTATEAQIVQQGAGLRLDRRQNAMKRLYLEAYNHINAIIFENWKIPKVVEVLGNDGQAQWYPVTGEDLKGDYNYRLGFSIGGNETLQERKQTAIQMFMSMLQTGLFDPSALARYLANAWNDPEFNSTFNQGVLNGQATNQGAGAFQGGRQGGGMGGTPAGGQAAAGGGQQASLQGAALG